MVVILVIASLVLAVVLVRRPFPQYSGEVSIPGLRSLVTVQRDARGIPQVYADNPEDLFRAQGYLQAQDQFFTMDWRRHVAAGRLSELVGDSTDALASDKLVRTLGWRRVAEAEERQLDSVTRSYLQAYVAGVNDYLAGRSASQLSLNYTVLSLKAPLTKIEPWTVVDSLTWFQAMAWQLRGNGDDELVRVRVLGMVKEPDRVDELYPPYPYDRHQPVLSADSVARLPSSGSAGTSAPASNAAERGTRRTGNSGTGTRVTREATKTTKAERLAAQRAAARVRQQETDVQALEHALLGGDAQTVVEQARQAVSAVPSVLGGGRAVGANAWVVSGTLTASGKPLLVDDLQLATSIPGVWYQMGLHCSTVSGDCPFDVSGFTFVGVPGIVIGHNARVSWGLNSLGPDVDDYYLERVTSNSYLLDDEQVPITTRQETIAVAGSDPVTFVVRSTKRGPIVSDLTDPAAAQGSADGGPEHQYAVSIATTSAQPGHHMQAVFALDVAKDFTTFRAATQKFDAPALSFVYADVDGHIGYQMSGRVPQFGTSETGLAAGRAAGRMPTDGSWPLAGWNSDFTWSGTVPASQLPWVLDPTDGMVIAANQPVTGPGYPMLPTADWDYGYRAQRIRDLITTKVQGGHKLTVADAQAIQGDTYNPMAAELVPLLLQVKTDASFAFTADAKDLLKDWKSYTQPTDSAAAAYYNAVWASLLNLTFSDEMPEGTRPDGGQRWFEVVRTVLRDPRSLWWDDHRTPDLLETQTEVLRQAMIQARLRLTSLLGKETERWEWGHLHRVQLTGQPLGSLGPTSILHPLINRGRIEVAGGSSVVAATSWDASASTFAVTAAPSLRMIVDLSDLDGSRWINATGESAHPGQAHYTDQVDAWAEGQTFGWPFSREAVRRVTKDTLTFKGPG